MTGRREPNLQPFLLSSNPFPSKSAAIQHDTYSPLFTKRQINGPNMFSSALWLWCFFFYIFRNTRHVVAVVVEMGVR